MRFQRDELGNPLVMYIRDLLGACPVCRHEVIERVYDQIDYHRLTVARFRRLCIEAPGGFSRECEQCGERLTAPDVRRWVVRYGFPQRAGMLQGFVERTAEGLELRFALSPHERFDVQMQPEFEVDQDQSIHVAADISDDDCLEVLGRYLSVKSGWRRALKPHFEDGAGGVTVRELAPASYALVGLAPGALTEALADLVAEADAGPLGDWLQLSLADGIGKLVPHGPREWLPGAWYAQLEGAQVYALAAGSVRQIEHALRSAIARLPVELTVDVDADDNAAIEFPLGLEGTERVSVSLRYLLAESLMTGAAPGDWVGLWLDEVISRLAAPSADQRIG